MIVRQLLEDEYHKAHEAAHIAFNYPVDMQKAKESKLTGICVGAFLDDDETIMSKIDALDMRTSFYGEYVPTLGIAGVVTKPEYRRAGCVREIFNRLFDMAQKRGWEISYLYPFSYTYYRKFGYERICDSLELELPITELSFLPRTSSVKLYESGNLKDDILSVYLAYGRDNNCLIYPDERMYKSHVGEDPYKDKKYTYIWYDPENKPGAYATFVIDEEILTVQELVFTDRASLEGILGFLRNFDGQVRTVRFKRIATDSPVLLLLKEFTLLKANLSFNAMGRVLDAEKLLRRKSYSGSGRFSVKVKDSLEINDKIFTVEYENGASEISSRKDGPYDVALAIQAFTYIILGADGFNLEKASYLADFEVKNRRGAENFLNAFPKRSISMFEHF